MGRDIYKVLEKIEQVLKEDEKYRNKIEHIKNSLRFKPPEDEWNYVYDVLITDFIPPNSETAYKVLSIWTTKSIEELKEMEDK